MARFGVAALVIKALKIEIYKIIESSAPGDRRRGRWFNRFMVFLILTNVACVVLETVEAINQELSEFFYTFELISVVIFTVEYVFRLWVCTEHDNEAYTHPIKGRIKYAMSPLALIDLLAIAPFFLGIFFSIDLRFMRVFRILRLLKLTRYNPALESFGAVVRTEGSALGALFMLIMVLVVVFACLVYMAEHIAQPDAFGNIPKAMWWALATLTTVGYGDIAPITPYGKVIGSMTMLLGVCVFAIPAGILANGFAREIRKREFIITWQLVAANPIFSKLDALHVSEVANLLHHKSVPPNFTIVQKRDPADSMYFIANGEVAVQAPGGAVRLGKGDFFGEIAILTASTRTATVVSLTECDLLYLLVEDFEHLLSADPDLKDVLSKAMKERLEQLEHAHS
ncbi:MAG: cyclic nucleotide-binding domain-containing protein [Rhodospirillaceae bacterium]|nr:cyclic nucleotide-binding domain-containing protein [Rhodospirillaceae bacterium]